MLTYDSTRWQSISAFAADARREYDAFFPIATAFASELQQLLEKILKRHNFRIQQVTARPKDQDSYEKKASKPNPQDPTLPRYTCPSRQIEDKVGARIICYYSDDVQQISTLIRTEFDELDTVDKAAQLVAAGKLGYVSLHHIIQLGVKRSEQPEYASFAGIRAELQIRTVLQHAWAEIEHDQYKAHNDSPGEIQRSFILLAGLIELADKEFLRVRNLVEAQSALTREAITSSSPAPLGPDSLMHLIEEEFGIRETDSDLLVASAAHTMRLGFNDASELARVIRDQLGTRTYCKLAVRYEEAIIRYYIALALAVGTTRFREVLHDDELADESGWPSLISEIDRGGD